MVANRQERGCGRQHRECSRADRISGRTNGRRKRTKSGSNTSVVPVLYSSRTKIVQAVLDRQRSGVMATIWWFCQDHDRSGRSAMIGNIGKEWSAQCDLGIINVTDENIKQIFRPQNDSHFENVKILNKTSIWHQIWEDHLKLCQKKNFAWWCHWWHHSVTWKLLYIHI